MTGLEAPDEEGHVLALDEAVRVVGLLVLNHPQDVLHRGLGHGREAAVGFRGQVV